MKKPGLVYKMSIHKTLVYITSAVAAFSLCACSREAGQPQSESPAVVVSEPMTQEAATKAQEEADKLQEAAPGTLETEPGSPEAVTVEPEATAEGPGETEAGSGETEAEAGEAGEAAEGSKGSGQPEQDTAALADRPGQEASTQKKSDLPDIIWIGDSLTQGSLGDDNHNNNNPQAPWRVLGEISGLKVSGVGFYGYTTHNIFWAYSEYNGLRDPQVTYVYWVGSNDCHESPDNVKNVIEETDRFNANNGITDFLMLGTTDRSDMPAEYADSFNKALSDYYGDKYLDILPYVEYGPDGVHLTEESYAAVARAVYEKLSK